MSGVCQVYITTQERGFNDVELNKIIHFLIPFDFNLNEILDGLYHSYLYL